MIQNRDNQSRDILDSERPGQSPAPAPRRTHTTGRALFLPPIRSPIEIAADLDRARMHLRCRGYTPTDRESLRAWVDTLRTELASQPKEATMPCDQQAAAEQQARALRRLEEQLLRGQARVERDAFGRVTITGWQGDRAGLCDDCAAARLAQSADLAVRALVAQASSPAAMRRTQ